MPSLAVFSLLNSPCSAFAAASPMLTAMPTQTHSLCDPPSSHSPPAGIFRFFDIPLELRFLVYEYVFAWVPEDEDDRPHTPQILAPLLTCRRLCDEARLIAFSTTTHYLRFFTPLCEQRRLRVQCRLQALPAGQVSRIRHIAFDCSALLFHSSFFLLPAHLDHRCYPFLNLRTLTIFLECPERHRDSEATQVWELNKVLTAVWYYKNIQKVVIFNMTHRRKLQEIADGGCWFPAGEAVETEDDWTR